MVGLGPLSAAGARWTWLRDGTAVPAPDALDRLMEALEALDGLPPPAAGIEWTAHVLRRGHGYLVPASVVAAAPPPGPVEALDPDLLRDLSAGVTLLLGRAFTPREKLWLDEVAAEHVGVDLLQQHERLAEHAAVAAVGPRANGRTGARRAATGRTRPGCPPCGSARPSARRRRG